jgi:lipoate-protein ligase A
MMNNTPFVFVESDPSGTDPLQDELALLDMSAHDRRAAQLWEAPVSLVVPRSYLRYPRFETARATFAQRGCPVWLRMSGGGLVPQGPGILNLSLVYAVTRPPGALSEAVYLHLCEVVGGALRSLGVATHWQSVDGSFCDGRFNLAWGPAEQARKIAGTAQYWRRAPASMQTDDNQRHLVLAHAVLLVSADIEEINERANAFENEAGSGRRYDAHKVVSVQEAMGDVALVRDGSLMSMVSRALKESLGGIALPQ